MKWLQKRRDELAETKAKLAETERMAQLADKQEQKADRINRHATRRKQLNHLSLIFEGIIDEGRRHG